MTDSALQCASVGRAQYQACRRAWLSARQGLDSSEDFGRFGDHGAALLTFIQTDAKRHKDEDGPTSYSHVKVVGKSILV